MNFFLHGHSITSFVTSIRFLRTSSKQIMHSLNKNSYLQSRTCGINPRIINRCVDRARENISFDVHDLEPSFNRLASEQPGIPADNCDITRRPLAFGRRAIPKLIAELHDPETGVVLQALNSLSDLLHNPEKGYEAIRLRLPDRMIDLLRHPVPEIREMTCMCLRTIAGLADGREAILRKKQMLENLALTLEDDQVEVRMKLASCLEMISRFWKAADILVEAGFVEKLLDNLDDKSDIIVVHLETLRSLMYCDGKEKAFEFKGFHIFVELLDSPFEEVQANAAACLSALISVDEGKRLALEEKLLPKLHDLLESEYADLQGKVASAIMFSSVKTKAKIKAAKLKNLPKRLIDLAKSPLYEKRQLYCFKALTNICEHPAIREEVCKNYLEEIEAIQVYRGDQDLLRIKDVLLGVIKWVPTIG